MSSLEAVSVPILSCEQARTLEQSLFEGDESREWQAMRAAGRGIAVGILGDSEEIGGLRPNARVLVLVGKGHNGGDALIAAMFLLARRPDATAAVVFAFGERALRPLATRAWRELQQTGGSRVTALSRQDIGQVAAASDPFAVCIDGVFGFQFRPPLDVRTRELLETVNGLPISFRAAVDLPSADVFRADFTYATGSVKQPAVSGENAGRVRYLDLGFFERASNGPKRSGGDTATQSSRVLTTEILRPLAELRPARTDKRRFGHVFIIGGSRGFPGAVLMCAMAAVRSGAGLVTVFVPESLASSFAARLPEAMWVGWPETPVGSLALEGEHLFRQRRDRADALVIGPGLGREAETLALAQSIVASANVPLVIDADALQTDIVKAGDAARVITPHAGEFKRLAGDVDLEDYARDPKLTVVLKGPITRICSGGPVYHSFAGGPVLARGGSGDLLAGMIGTQVAQCTNEPTLAAARAVTWHGIAADCLARARGQSAVATTELLDYLGPALREGS